VFDGVYAVDAVVGVEVDDQREIVGLTGQGRHTERGDVVAHPVDPPLGVDRHHARAGPQQPDEHADLRRPVAEHDADTRPRRDRADDGVGRGCQVAPRVPLALELEGGCGRVDRQHTGDALAQRRTPVGVGSRHRSLGSGRSAPRSATSAWPIGLPSRV
jgi:hypothetical protein